MFQKILIANRGEIACRVIRTARKMGIRSVAVYSDVDRQALHVSMADEAVHIGGAASQDSYLQAARIIDAALKTGAQAIHPGYGFLSENAAFCKACKDNNIVFIGPPAAAIEAMGSKSAAKQIMENAGVPLLPGYHGANQSDDVLRQAADTLGYPVLLKAAAGGGGKGMRQVWQVDEFTEALAAAKRESRNAFGDDTMLVEKYLTQPRHIEIQVFCDQFANAVYLFERDCSVQRRHQKVIEEAPAPGMTPQLRDAMGQAAIQAARAIDYQGAGTVEFLLDSDGCFYFMEMNTRLQVEHPITEMISGQDLVEWQLRVAAGEPLPKQQEQLTITGHAFEARIYAEDPDNNFLPATGTLSFMETPVSSDHVRIDSGVRQGDEISVYYDPMIAKLVTWDEDREKALSRLSKALREYRISGLSTNIDFLYNLSCCAPFRNADVDTGFIEKHRSLLFRNSDHNVEKDLSLAVLYLLLKQQSSARHDAARSRDRTSPWHHTGAWRSVTPNLQTINLVCDNQPYRFTVEHKTLGNTPCYHITPSGTGDTFIGAPFIHGAAVQDTVVQNTVVHKTVVVHGTIAGNTLRANVDGHELSASVAEHDNNYRLYTGHTAVTFRQGLLQEASGDNDSHDSQLLAPMNGTVVTLLAKPGSTVEKADALLVIEAMKMEHTIRAPAAGTIEAFYFQPGELVDGGTKLVDFIPK